MIDRVWIVQHDSSPNETVLGVFATMQEAHEFAETVGKRFPNGAIFTSYPIGYRYDQPPHSTQFFPDDPT
ncbi:MAG TPA: hypothetical protein VFU07_04100 [Candidatus Lumbricidophila sp.]|nr:hypothetical protein [Candidatus Lumbricidophila sp.]